MINHYISWSCTATQMKAASLEGLYMYGIQDSINCYMAVQEINFGGNRALTARY